MPAIPEETIPAIIDVLAALAESGTDIRMYTNWELLLEIFGKVVLPKR